jgi:hypothetical protein
MSATWLVGCAAVCAAVLATGAMGARPLAGPQLVAVELQPEDPSPGGQFVAVANRTKATVNIGCWRLRSSIATMTVRPPLVLRPGKIALLSPDHAWLGRVDRVRLVDAKGRLRDATPELADRASDDRIWFREGTGAWRFGRTSLGRGVVAGRLLQRLPSRC